MDVEDLNGPRVISSNQDPAIAPDFRAMCNVIESRDLLLALAVPG